MSERKDGGKDRTGGPAFPFTCQGPTTGPEFYYGLSLRAYIATEALQGILASSRCLSTFEAYAKCAVNHADALLAELDKP